MKIFTFYKQPDQMDCGPTCLRMVARHYGKNFSLQKLRDISGLNREGVSLLGISEAAEKIGFRTAGAKIGLDELKKSEFPLILHWDQNHFVVLYKVKKEYYHIADPAKGLLKYSENEFLKHWSARANNEKSEGIVLLLSPAPDFYLQEGDKTESLDLSYLAKYLYRYKALVIQLFAGLGVGSLLQLILPFLTQSVVDIGINTRNINFIYIILIAQTMLFIGRTSVDFIRSWILLHISTRINISILTDFLIKLMKLPMHFFDSKMTGDIMQRMNDQKRIESFLTGSTLTVIFSLFNLIVFGFVLAFYNITIFIIFVVSTVLYSIWVMLFLRKRRSLDFKRFDLSSQNQSAVVQLISGMQEIKLNNCEQQKRWEWERLQAGLFRFNIKSLKLTQYQQAGAFFINEGKNIIITFLVAKSVVDGQLTLGAMMAVQYIIGQLNSPIEQMLGFVQQFQDAKISLERLNEIREMDDEEPLDKTFIKELPFDKGISLQNLTFSYPGAGNEPVLSNITLDIPEGKTTAIVGMSGSGKTTILKLLLRFYEPEKGDIKIGNSYLNQVSFRYWRSLCGVVMQDGFIFSDSIARNIAAGDEYPDITKLKHAIEMANITDFIENLPLGLNTKIGAEGNGISQGQRQRILIARAIYKNPKYIFFDEATNALDAINEKVIMENLETFFKGRTVVVVAHRLSTVKNADNIVVLDKGVIIEQGTHAELTESKGEYYLLVKNQLELGN
ncbi:peptidase domain-containing ABC transporter [Pedobacter sp. ISL-68]|uniref:peptidase domain-containing ABC transporter n=1 Tax=unclassified Pedobacter TaxID=2628915 RepID=UPI001BE7AEC6|nr:MULTISPECIES: peptidase domain-containing ABC transporter [unclassified Pedobacter]MBT2559786.1 peptidase domain-containing ABC transporter [Pedobacter sp. ISL-64]MBT2592091.1 peptidase domain-containing ABC transporter [Pedobacter sp. ISL-68]